MRLSSISRLLSLAVLALAASGASAFVWTFNDVLDAAEETPPNGSPATGIASGTYDDVTNMMHIHVMASGFVANLTAGHIHEGPVGVPGPVRYNLVNTMAGTTWMSDDMHVFSEAHEAIFLAHGFYVNLHTLNFPVVRFGAN